MHSGCWWRGTRIGEVEKKIEARRRAIDRVSLMCKRKDGFIENDVTRDYDTASLKVKASVALVLSWVAEKDARDGARSELMLGGCGLVGVAEAPEGPKETVVRIFAVKLKVWYGKGDGLRRSYIDKVCRRGNSLGLVGWWHRGLK
jgi:hypothetical protein